jgi:hypothetical protein
MCHVGTILAIFLASLRHNIAPGVLCWHSEQIAAQGARLSDLADRAAPLSSS